MKNETKVKGFKAMHPDMTCRDFKFEVGETFRHVGEVVPCKSGFHFCQDISDCRYYYRSNCRIFEVEASGVVVDHDAKTVTDTLTIVREIDYVDYINHDDSWVRCVVAGRGVGLDVLINDKNDSVRKEVAKQGYGLDKLVHDSFWMTRLEVANQGYGLDILIHDINRDVRAAVAFQDYGLDELANDSVDGVRSIARMRLREIQENNFKVN